MSLIDYLEGLDGNAPSLFDALDNEMLPPPPKRPNHSVTLVATDTPTPTARSRRRGRSVPPAAVDNEVPTNHHRVNEVTLSGQELLGAEEPSAAALGEQRDFALTDYNRNAQAATSTPLEVARATANRAMMGYINFMINVSNDSKQAPRAEYTAAGSGFGQAFLRAVLEQSPHRSRPASDLVSSAELRKATRSVVRADIERQLCTPRRDVDVKCVNGADCAGYRLRNANGELIGGSELAAFVHEHERVRMQTDRAAFRRELAQRMCILCKMRAAARVQYNLMQANAAADVRAGTATDFHCRVNEAGEYPDRVTIGPGTEVFEMFTFNIPRYSERGWRRVESLQEGCTYFVNDFMPPYPEPPDFFDEHRRAGF